MLDYLFLLHPHQPNQAFKTKPNKQANQMKWEMMSKTQWWQVIYGSILPAIFLNLISEEGAKYPHRNHHFPTNQK